MTANQRHRPIENEQPNEKPKSEVSVGKISRVEHGILIQIASTTPDATIPSPSMSISQLVRESYRLSNNDCNVDLYE
ncbi:hypothetical protein DAPPUDRAFT_269665 [Daphnia pulex]|uniref:Uncharacterized protein n=1 Tax=Daphnia pulex TaxID=6669 RepID=E9HZL0_DAPPU|nr:hypothetical protein DAPPUDRAFT_269665 [Daphnia pulex]|eukprot:EFX62818.1 hypothetical protein DAPPUDRAFT_269665 [Daphnia pulex]